MWPGDGRLSIASQQARWAGSQGDYGNDWWSANSFGPDVEVYVDVPTPPQWESIGIHAILSPGTYAIRGYHCGYDGYNQELFLYVFDNSTDTWTDLGSSSLVLSAGDAIGLEKNGSSIKCYRRSGGVWTQVLSATDTTYSGPFYLGFESNDPGARLDNFGGGTIPQARAPFGVQLAGWFDTIRAWMTGLVQSARLAFALPVVQAQAEQEEEVLPPEGQIWKNYVLVGGQRVAVREYTASISEVYFLLGDHLGSTSVTTDSAGVLVSELRYTAYGEIRISNGDTVTDYQYTGQLSKTESIGLYYYNARWYDPYLNHFVQADTIVSNPNNPKDIDRYSYVRNNPIRLTDPSGYKACYEDGYCGDAPLFSKTHLEYLRKLFGVKFVGDWDFKNQWSVISGVQDMAGALGKVTGLNDSLAFRQTYGVYGSQQFVFEWGCSECSGFGLTLGTRHVIFGGMYTNQFANTTLTVHELFHALENAIFPYGGDYKIFRDSLPDAMVNRLGLMSRVGNVVWQHSESNSRGEVLADMGVGWVYDKWFIDPLTESSTDPGAQKRGWMNLNIATFVGYAIYNQRGQR